MPYLIDEEALYSAIQVITDPDLKDIRDIDFVYDIYNPALAVVEGAATLIADSVWYQGKKFDWAPNDVTDSVKKGMRTGYLLGKVIFDNG